MTMPKALVVDDEPDIRELLSMTLHQLGLDVTTAASLAEGINVLKAESFAVCITDMRLPDGDGLNLIDHIQLKYPELPVAMITAYGNTDLAVQALQRGAFDFVSKPIQLQRLRTLVQSALKLASPPAANESLGAAQEFIGASPAIQNLRREIARVARSQAPVCIRGPSGSGKEIVARSIHRQSPRADRPFVPVNCGAIPTELMESEFFGHIKGSFTGAHQDKRGLFEVAEGGTLFLDEIAELPLPMQVKLLRAIQEKTIRRVGEGSELNVDVRILSATHRDLEQDLSDGRFRQDLYYRINVIEIAVPALRDHPQDIPALADYFLKRLGEESGMEAPLLSPAALATLEHYSFPGNVRELENILERAFTLCEHQRIEPRDLRLSAESMSAATAPGNTPQRHSPAPHDSLPSEADILAAGNLEKYLEDIERAVLERTLLAARWNKTLAAERLGLSFRQIRYKLKKLGIE
ncbi:MAG: sigma-54-dependent Fis family transcriptional regulator [Gammaproteobacteria bacterium]|nr:sigma-54-dependent Fis family transcriptional regulator [Gammaproteobacteria bacterium]